MHGVQNNRSSLDYAVNTKLEMIVAPEAFQSQTKSETTERSKSLGSNTSVVKHYITTGPSLQSPSQMLLYLLQLHMVEEEGSKPSLLNTIHVFAPFWGFFLPMLRLIITSFRKKSISQAGLQIFFEI